jgi:hypothetical protein
VYSIQGAPDEIHAKIDTGATINLGAGAAGGNTLDGSYDQGGAGAGRTITVDTGAVELVTTAEALDVRQSGDTNPRLRIDHNSNILLGPGNAVTDVTLSRGANGVLDVANIVDANTGFRVAGAAASGNVLRGDGTNFISAALDFSDLAGTHTLDEAYDSGGAGAGRTITADTGPVTVNGTALEGDDLILVTHPAAGDLTANTIGPVIFQFTRTLNAGADGVSDNFVGHEITKNSVANLGGQAFNTTGTLSLIRIQNTQTAGTLADTTKCVEMKVPSAATYTGVPLFIGLDTDVNPTLSVTKLGAVQIGPGGGTAVDTILSRTAAGILDVANVVDANTGFRVAGAAASGEYLRGDGTNFISSTIQTADVPDGADATAIHDNVASEISAITEKVSPVGADMLIIEDSAAANVKKRVQITNLPAGGEINDLEGDGASGILDNEVPVGTGAGTVSYLALSTAGAVSFNGTAFSQAALADLSDVTAKTGSGTTVVMDTSPTIVTPTIASFANAAHDHEDAAGGATLASAATPTAIHDDIASEISAVTLKATPVSGDFLLIEDSAAANVKKRITVGSLPAGSEINDLEGDGASGILDNEVPVGTGAGTVSYLALSTAGAVSFNGTAFAQAALADLSDVTAKTGSGTTVVMDTSPTIVTPTIASFANAAHDHEDAAGGATLASAATPTAIHDDVAAEISALTEKVSPVGADHILIEDSAAGNAKKRIQITNLPAGGEINDLEGDGASGILDNEVPVGTGAGTVSYLALSTAGAVSFNGTAFSQAALADLSDVTAKTGSGTTVVMDTSPTIVTPTIASFANAAHDHEDAAGGATLASAATPTAIHDDVASEISAVTLKATPVSGDFLLIEDSAAANVKKRVTIGSLPAGSEVNNLEADGAADIADHEVPVGTGAGTVSYQVLPTTGLVAFDGTNFALGTLDDAYNGGNSVTVDGSAVQLINTELGGGPLILDVQHTASGALTAKTTALSTIDNVRTLTSGSASVTDTAGGTIYYIRCNNQSANTFTANANVLAVNTEGTNTGGGTLSINGHIFAATHSNFSTSSSMFLDYRRFGNANARFQVDRDGFINFGDGTAAVDTTLSRTAAGVLDLVSILDVNTGLRVAGAAATGNVLRGDGTNFVSATLAAGDLSDGVPNTRTITIAGTANQITSSAGAQDLSANRTWTLSLPDPLIVPGALEIPNGAGGTTVDTDGEVTVDTTSRTFNFHDGTAEVVLNPLHGKAFLLENPVAADDLPVYRFEAAATLEKVVYAITGGTNWVGQTQEADDAQGTGAADNAAADSTVTGTTTVTTFSNASFDAGDYLRIKTTSQSGNPTWLHVTFYYRETP